MGFLSPSDRQPVTVHVAAPQQDTHSICLYLFYSPNATAILSPKVAALASATTSTYQPDGGEGTRRGEMRDLECDSSPHFQEHSISAHSKYRNYGTSREQIPGKHRPFSITEHIFDFLMPSTVLVLIRNH